MRLDFDSLHASFRRSCLDALGVLIHSYNSISPFYALCVYVDGFDGDFALYANSQKDFDESLAEYRVRWPDDFQQPDEVIDLKYNCGDWKFSTLWSPPDFCASFEPMSKWRDQVHALCYEAASSPPDSYYHRLEEIGCSVAIDLKHSAPLAELNRTSDFEILVAGHDEPSIVGIERLKWFIRHGSLTDFEPMRYASE
jgi:hypothetical protein